VSWFRCPIFEPFWALITLIPPNTITVTINRGVLTFRLDLDKPECKKCSKVLMELENIDDEADQLGIGFVKINDENLAEEYNLEPLPALVYYRHQIPIIYEGELTREEDVLEWLVQHKSTGDEDDVIEDVTLKTLGTLISSVDHLAVLFCKYRSPGLTVSRGLSV
jgi:hypothetical protein